ncbi:MAG: nitroreductase family protein [Candidatus Aureabacteria bacterium]|nr:nitroreductase family protein [Candidatus Auribacterota bacterium]
MRFLDLVKRRRSVRRYAPAAVSRAAIDRCLEAARLAPSACNAQPWSFVVVDQPGRAAEIARSVFGGVYSMNRFAGDAPVLIAAVTGRSTPAARLGGLFRNTRYPLIDIGIACEHLALQAAEEGLGTCWIGAFYEAQVKQILGIPEEARVVLLLTLGHPSEPLVPAASSLKKRKKLEDIVCREKWS